MSKPKSPAWKVVWTVVKYVLALSLLGWVVWSYWDPPKGHGLAEVWQKHVLEGQPIRWDYLTIAALICLASTLLTFVRWYVLVRALDLPFTLTNALRLGAVGFFFSTFLPGSVGGDVIKAAFIAREQSRRTAAVATVIMDRVLALWALFALVAVLGGAFWSLNLIPPETQRPTQIITWVSAAVVVVSLPLWALLGVLPPARAERFAGRLERVPKAGPALAELWRSVWMYRQRQRSVFLVVILSWIGHVGFVLTFWFCALTLLDTANPDAKIPSLAEHFLIVPFGLLIQAIPLFPGGLGIGEAGFGSLYKLMGCAEANGVLGSLVQRVITWLLALLGYVFYQVMGPPVPAPAPVPVDAAPLAAAEAS